MAEQWPMTYSTTIAVAWWARGPTAVAMPRSRTCGPSPTSGSTNITSTVIATRGERLALSRTVLGPRPAAPRRSTPSARHRRDRRRRADRGARRFDPDDIDAAFEELDARYLAGEAAAHAHTWSVIARAYAAFNRREIPATTPDWVNIDHRRRDSFAPGDLIAYVRATWDLAPQAKSLVCRTGPNARSRRPATTPMNLPSTFSLERMAISGKPGTR